MMYHDTRGPTSSRRFVACYRDEVVTKMMTKWKDQKIDENLNKKFRKLNKQFSFKMFQAPCPTKRTGCTPLVGPGGTCFGQQA